MMELHPEAADAMTIWQINRWFMLRDESHLWPVKGRFNATDRAINRLQGYEYIAYRGEGAAYAANLREEISRLVNSCV
jgi:hypothetical protein